MNFSMYSNALRLFNVNRPQTGDHLGCLDGLRIISMTWVVLGHSFSNINGTAAITNTAFEAPLVSNLSKWPFKFQINLSSLVLFLKICLVQNHVACDAILEHLCIYFIEILYKSLKINVIVILILVDEIILVSSC